MWLRPGKRQGACAHPLALPLSLSPDAQFPDRFESAGVIAPGRLTNLRADIYWANGQNSAVGDAAYAVQRFVANGGGLITGAQTWYFSGPDTQHPSNKLLMPMGACAGMVADGCVCGG